VKNRFQSLPFKCNLQRYEAGKAGAAGAAGAAGKDDGKVSDTEKICKQLHLDVCEYGAQLAKLGVDPATRETFRALWWGSAG
jgi:hypothetical protein